MTCPHKREPLSTAPFQVAKAAWAMDYCVRCGERRWFVVSPHKGELVDQVHILQKQTPEDMAGG
jgi:hypothetical protein